MKNILVAIVAILFSIAANAAEVTTKDGKTTFEVSDSGVVTSKDGSKVEDGSYTLSDGTTLNIKDGKKQ